MFDNERDHEYTPVKLSGARGKMAKLEGKNNPEENDGVIRSLEDLEACLPPGKLCVPIGIIPMSYEVKGDALILQRSTNTFKIEGAYELRELRDICNHLLDQLD